MKNILKTFALFTVISLSFVFAQDEVDQVKGKDAKTIGVDAQQKANTVTPKVKPTTEAKVKMKSHEQCDNCSKDVGKSEALKKGSFSSAVNAETNRGKAAGLYIDRKIIKTGKLDDMSLEELEARMKKIEDDYSQIIDVTPDPKQIEGDKKD